MALVLSAVPNDASWVAVSKFVACSHYLGLTRAEADRAFDSWLMLPGHMADHFRSETGRTQLRAVYRRQHRRHQQAIRDGDVIPGMMRPPSIRARYRDMAAYSDLRIAA
jgi:hypothetical protein